MDSFENLVIIEDSSESVKLLVQVLLCGVQLVLYLSCELLGVLPLFVFLHYKREKYILNKLQYIDCIYM